jgi:hypothetical protein
MTTPLERVMERFPQQAELAVNLTARSEEFRSLCEDYALVVETLARLQQQRRPPSDNSVQEYQSYLLELELDIADALTNGSP